MSTVVAGGVAFTDAIDSGAVSGVVVSAPRRGTCRGFAFGAFGGMFGALSAYRTRLANMFSVFEGRVTIQADHLLPID